MSKKNEIFLSKSICFATEMVRACLRLILKDTDPNRRWLQMEVRTGVIGDRKLGQRWVQLQILTNPDIKISAHCDVDSVNGNWVSGQARLFIFDRSGHMNRNTQHWLFLCELDVDGQIVAELKYKQD